MVRNRYPYFVFVLFLVSAGIYSYTIVSAEEKKGVLTHTEGWSVKMQEMLQVLSRLVVFTSSDSQFNAKGNQRQIEKDVNQLSSLAHGLNMPKAKSPDLDPSVAMMAKLFQDETQHAALELKRGHRDYARSILRSVTGYCIACHTRNNSGPIYPKLNSLVALEKLSPLEKGEYFSATRQYEPALREFKKLLNDPNTSTGQLLNWNRAVRDALAIEVRVNDNPKGALEIVDAVLSSKQAPFFMKESASQWKKSLQEWLKEPSQKAMTDEGMFTEAKRLFVQARSLQSAPLDESGMIDYLRATAILHTLLNRSPNGPNTGQAFLMAGIAYQALRDMNLSDFHELYFEACIFQEPNSKTAQVCFQRYQESIYAGYSGSSGTHIPDDVKEKLIDLEKMSSVQPDRKATENMP